MTVDGETKPYHEHLIETFLTKMFEHWGLKLKNGKVEVFDMGKFKTYIANPKGDHNQLRFSRVCICLNAFKHETRPELEEAFQALKVFVETNPEMQNVSSKTKQTWNNALS